MSFAARTGLGTAASTSLGAYLKNGIYIEIASPPATATATWTASNSGLVTVAAFSGGESYTWLTGSGVVADYSIRLTVNSGTSPNEPGSSAVNSWLPLSVTRFWGLTTSGGIESNDCTIEIAETGNLTNIIASASSVQLGAESVP
tara:strand:+ start:349 stop:783 length:435 start_codon:yes stop_codon:yes gene_type:complete